MKGGIPIWFDKYKIIRLLSQSESSDIYLIEHIKLKIFRVAKRISKSHKLYEQLIGEAHILKDLKHSCIPIIYDIEEDKDYSYIIEEYIEGTSLKVFRLNLSQVSQEVIVGFGIQICQLIEYLHTDKKHPILYLDLKPDNIIVSEGTLKLIDFGTAVYTCDLKNRKYMLGTKGYAAPEQYTGNYLDERSDIYSIGMLLYFLVTGSIFNNSGNISNIDKFNTCPTQLKSIINQCLRHNPAQRYSKVKQLNNQLSTLIKANTNTTQSEKSLTISLAGSQNRIGTTHISFLLTTYLDEQGYNCLYMERNPSNQIQSIASRYEITHNKDIFRIHRCNILWSENNSYCQDLDKYNVLIHDYGTLTNNNKEQFLESDFKILVLGSKEWELEYSEQILKELSDCKSIHYLFNYIDSELFKRVLKNMKGNMCYRMTYEANSFKPKELTKELFDEMLKGTIIINSRKKRRKLKLLQAITHQFNES